MAAPLIGPGTRTQAGIDNHYREDPARAQGGTYLSRAGFSVPYRQITHQHIAIRRDSGLSRATGARPMPVKPTASRPLTGGCCTAFIALQNQYFRWCMKDDIVDRVLSSSGCVVSMPTHDRLLKYLRLMASTGKSEEQLVRLGSAYLKETLRPDPRYSGC